MPNLSNKHFIGVDRVEEFIQKVQELEKEYRVAIVADGSGIVCIVPRDEHVEKFGTAIKNADVWWSLVAVESGRGE